MKMKTKHKKKEKTRTQQKRWKVLLSILQRLNMGMFSRVGSAAHRWQTQRSWPCTDVLFRNVSASSPRWERSPGARTRCGAVRSLLRGPAAAPWSTPPRLRTLCSTASGHPGQNWRVPSGKRRRARGCWRGSWCCRRRFSAGARNTTQAPAWTRKLRARNGWKGENERWCSLDGEGKHGRTHRGGCRGGVGDQKLPASVKTVHHIIKQTQVSEMKNECKHGVWLLHYKDAACKPLVNNLPQPSRRQLSPRCCLSEVWRALEGQAAKSSLDVDAALRDGAGVAPCRTFINVWERRRKQTAQTFHKNNTPTRKKKKSSAPSSIIIRCFYTILKVEKKYLVLLQIRPLTLTCASIGCEGVARWRTGAVEASWGVGAAVGAHMAPSRQSALIDVWEEQRGERGRSSSTSRSRVNIQWAAKVMETNSTFTCYPINVTQLVTAATVALIGAVDVGTFLAARVGLTLVHICQKTNKDTMCFFFVFFLTTLSAHRRILTFYFYRRITTVPDCWLEFLQYCC